MNAIKGYLTGRSRRGEYWGSVVALLLTAGVVSALGHQWLGNVIGFVCWCPIAIRRLRAIGWSPWLCLLPAGGGFGVGVLFGMARTIFPEFTVDTATMVSKAVAVVITWIFIIFIGVRPSLKPAATLDEAPRLAEVFD
ncbi:hypothetical protein AS593_20060 [Caulobacter vibrioides]|nr:hypothetical protein AS593_20060 [Caulobacter vibrioides]